MKMSVLYLFAVILVGAQIRIQADASEKYLDTPVHLQCQATPLRRVLDEISGQTQIHFVYWDSLVNNILLSCDLDNEPLDKALSIILNSNIHYQVVDDDLIVLLGVEQIQSKPIPENQIDTHITSQRTPYHSQPPKLLKFNKPDYPKEAVKQNESGKVTLFIRIDKNGQVETVVIKESSGSGLLDSTAVKHAKKSRFRPAYSNHVPVPVWMEWDFDFKLSGEHRLPTSVIRQ